MAYASPNKPPTPVRFKVTCIDDSGRPNEIPLSKWVRKGNVYTVIAYTIMVQQNTLGFFLDEIDLSGCEPYRTFHSSRFAQADVAPVMEAANEKVNENEIEFEPA